SRFVDCIFDFSTFAFASAGLVPPDSARPACAFWTYFVFVLACVFDLSTFAFWSAGLGLLRERSCAAFSLSANAFALSAFCIFWSSLALSATDLSAAAGPVDCAIATVETAANVPAINVASNLFIQFLLKQCDFNATPQPSSGHGRVISKAKALKLYGISPISVPRVILRPYRSMAQAPSRLSGFSLISTFSCASSSLQSSCRPRRSWAFRTSWPASPRLPALQESLSGLRPSWRVPRASSGSPALY